MSAPTEAPERSGPAPNLSNTAAPAPLGPEELTVEEQLILEHEGQAALFEMGEAIPDVPESPSVTIPEQPEPDKDDKQPPTPGKDDPAPAHSGKVVDFSAARDEAAKEEKKAVIWSRRAFTMCRYTKRKAGSALRRGNEGAKA